MSNKIRVAKPGFNVLTETDLDNIVYDSDYNTLKYSTSGTVTLTAAGVNISTTITHNLGYIPFFTAFVQNQAFLTDYSMAPFTFSDFGFYTYINVYADSTKLYFQITTNSLVGDVIFYYKIFKNNTGL